nr:Asd/ArgC dimerization domain-containing protein [Pseudomonas chlororaphis]
MSLPALLEQRLRLPVVAAPMFLISNPQLVLACCRNGVVGSFPALNQRESSGFKAWLEEIEAGLATLENPAAYAVKGHRHLPEIRQGLRRAAGKDVGLTFVPHLTPMIRGIHSTLYATVVDKSVDLQALFEKRYANEPFVDVMPAGSHPETRSVRGANVCRIAVHRPQDGDLVVVLSVIDNLVKGASGQAVQNLNILFGLDERLGLSHAGMLP